MIYHIRRGKFTLLSFSNTPCTVRTPEVDNPTILIFAFH